jgi:Transcriptional regulators
MNQRVTHRDIGEKTGFDKSTVSLALRGSPRLPEETRRKIVEMAEKMGYRPDPAIAMLARHRWANQEIDRGVTLVYLVHKKRPELELQRRHLAGARKRAEERGYNLVEFDLSAYPNGAAASKVLFNRGIRGVILPTMPPEVDPDLHDFQWEKFTVVGCSIGWLRTPFHIVTPDKFEGARLAWQQVVKRGYRRIGAAIFRHQPVAVDDFARLGASYAEQMELVAEADRVPFLLCPPSDREAFLAWVEKYRPDAIISLIAAKPYRWLTEAGYRVPEDIGLASLHAWPHETYSGVSLQTELIARSAVDFLIAQMLDNNWGVPKAQQVLLLEPEWHEGTTLLARAPEPRKQTAARPKSPAARATRKSNAVRSRE